MTYTLLRYEAPSIPPEARWMLWQWEHCIGLEHAVTCSVGELFKTLAMTSRQGQAALNVLKSKDVGAIIATSKPAGRGRPIYEYRLSPTMLEHLAGCGDAEPVLAADIDRLGDPSYATNPATADNCVSEKEAGSGEISPVANLLDGATRRAQMTLANRWVLMVLLAHANENGTVMDMPHARLQRLTGLSPNRWQSQRRKLHDLGVLARYQRGRPSQWEGRSLPLLYHLNLGHSCLNRPFDPAIRVELLPSGTIHHDTSLPDATVTALLTAAHTKDDPTKLELFQRGHYLLPSRRFTDIEMAVVRGLPNTFGVMAWLRGHVHWATTRLLNTAWEELRNDQAGSDMPAETVLQELEQALDHPLMAMGAEVLRAQIADEDGPPSEDAVDEATPLSPNGQAASYRAIWARLLYALAHQLARMLQGRLLESQPSSSDDTFGLGRLAYELFAVTAPPHRESMWRETRCWELCGYRDQSDEEKAGPVAPVVIGLFHSTSSPKPPSRQSSRGASFGSEVTLSVGKDLTDL